MKITRGLAEYKGGPHPVLTIGNFDGQHRGHVDLLQAVVARAAEVAGTAVVLTFDPHPLTVLKPDLTLRFLTSAEDKQARFREVGIDEVLLLPFDRALASLPPAEFVARILSERLGTRDLFVGEDFAFGKDRAGTMADLMRWAPEAGFRVHAVPAVRLDGEVVSSSRIRRLVREGDVRAAARCLGRPYALSGPVVRGERRGQEIGWPTANLRLPEDRVIPADGVYAATAVRADRRFDAVAYIGTRPTFGAGDRVLEVNLLDETLNLYGDELLVEFVERLRGDATFMTAEELAACIGRDVALARETLRSAARTLTGM
jgi:riboflavin kinase/FMN adenylyltransferase